MATPRNRSVYKAFDVLKAFQNADEWLTSSEISRRANLPIASGYRIIQTLEEVGAVVRGPNGRYRPGMLLVSLSQNVAVGDLLRDVSQEVLAELTRSFDVTAHVGILEDGMVTYLAKTCTPTSLETHTRPGSQLEAYSSGLGKVLLAALEKDEYRKFISEGELVALTPHTIVDPQALAAHLEEVRRQGFAVDRRESRLDMYCIAVPVHDRDGRAVAALSITDHAMNMTAERQAALRNALFETSAALGRKISPNAPRIGDIGAKAENNKGRRNQPRAQMVGRTSAGSIAREGGSAKMGGTDSRQGNRQFR